MKSLPVEENSQIACIYNAGVQWNYDLIKIKADTKVLFNITQEVAEWAPEICEPRLHTP